MTRNLVFSTVFSTLNPRFLQYDLLLTKNTIYMKHAQGQAGQNLFCRKSWKRSLIYEINKKPPKNHAKCLMCDLLRNCGSMILLLISSRTRPDFGRTYLEDYLELGAPIEKVSWHRDIFHFCSSWNR